MQLKHISPQRFMYDMYATLNYDAPHTSLDITMSYMFVYITQFWCGTDDPRCTFHIVQSGIWRDGGTVGLTADRAKEAEESLYSTLGQRLVTH